MSRMMVEWEGRVPEERWAELREVYERGTREEPPHIVEHMLVQDVEQPEMWRIISLWDSSEGLDEYRHTTPTPGAREMFEAVGVHASRWISNVESARVVASVGT